MRDPEMYEDDVIELRDRTFQSRERGCCGECKSWHGAVCGDLTRGTCMLMDIECEYHTKDCNKGDRCEAFAE